MNTINTLFNGFGMEKRKHLELKSLYSLIVLLLLYIIYFLMFFLEWCVPEGCTPICPPQQGEKLPMPEELTRKFLDKILDYMTRPVSSMNLCS